MKTKEFDVYSRLIDFFVERDWKILCSCPPGGTDNRYRKCIIPRRDLNSNIRGPRDEVDMIAYKNRVLLLIECKVTLSDSLTVLNALLESDYEKLKRILNSFSSNDLIHLISRGTSFDIESDCTVEIALAVNEIDTTIPQDINVFEIKENTIKLLGLERNQQYF